MSGPLGPDRPHDKDFHDNHDVEHSTRTTCAGTTRTATTLAKTNTNLTGTTATTTPDTKTGTRRRRRRRTRKKRRRRRRPRRRRRRTRPRRRRRRTRDHEGGDEGGEGHEGGDEGGGDEGRDHEGDDEGGEGEGLRSLQEVPRGPRGHGPALGRGPRQDPREERAGQRLSARRYDWEGQDEPTLWDKTNICIYTCVSICLSIYLSICLSFAST